MNLRYQRSAFNVDWFTIIVQTFQTIDSEHMQQIADKGKKDKKKATAAAQAGRVSTPLGIQPGTISSLPKHSTTLTQICSVFSWFIPDNIFVKGVLNIFYWYLSISHYADFIFLFWFCHKFYLDM